MVTNTTHSAGVRISSGTPVSVVFAQEIRTSEFSLGRRVDVRAASDLVVGGVVVVLEGSPVEAVVVERSAPGVVGAPGSLGVDFISTSAVDGQTILLSGQWEVRGRDQTVESIGITSFFCCLGLFIRGEDVKIAERTIARAFVEAPVDVEIGSRR